MYPILAINLYVHVLWLPLIIALSVFTGLLFRTQKLRKTRKQVLSLENDMIRSHADILRLEQKLAAVEKAASNPSPVVPMKDQADEQKDGGQRKSVK